MRLLKEEALALVIDYQEKLMPAIDRGQALTDRSVLLLRGLCALGVPRLITEQYPKGLGTTIAPIREAADSAVTLDKVSFSCCDDAAMLDFIRSSGKKTILICGIEAHVCVLQTVIDLRAMGYQVALVEDCIGSRSEADRQVGIKRAMQEGALLTSFESILFELTRRAKTPVFREISNLIK